MVSFRLPSLYLKGINLQNLLDGRLGGQRRRREEILPYPMAEQWESAV
jgi:hypothetical protein